MNEDKINYSSDRINKINKIQKILLILVILSKEDENFILSLSLRRLETLNFKL